MVGQTFRVKASRDDEHPAAWTVVREGSDYVAEDGLSFGVGDECGHIYYAVVRPATTEEEAGLVQREQARDERKAKRERIMDIYHGVRKADYHRSQPADNLEWMDIPHDRKYSTYVPHDAMAADPKTGLWARAHEPDWGWHYWCAPYDQEIADELQGLLG